MKNKTIIPIIVIVILLIVLGTFVILKNQKENINLEEFNTKISEMAPFDEMQTTDIDSEMLNSVFNINEDEYEECVGKMPMINVQSSMYIVVKAQKGKVDSVKEKIDNYGKSQEKSWSTYLPEQYDLVKNRKIGVIGNYVYLIIAEDSTEMENLLK